MNSKIAWADAEKPKHLVFFISSYLTNSAREWLRKVEPEKHYKVHRIEGKQLKQLVLKFPKLISKYFLDEYAKLIAESRKNWLVHDLLPEPHTLNVLSKNMDTTRLSITDMAFVYCSAFIRNEEVSKWCEDNDPFSFDFLFQPLRRGSNSEANVLSTYKDIELIQEVSGVNVWAIAYKKSLAADIAVELNERPRKALYLFVRGDFEDEGLEVLIEAISDFPTRIRYIPSNAFKELEIAKKTLRITW